MKPLIVILGPTASGKTALSLALAQRFAGEIVSCDSVSVYRYMDLGTAKPTAAERALVPHHCLDLYDPDQPCDAGSYARHARTALDDITNRKQLPILSGGSGLYLRALLDGLFPAPPQNPALRDLLRLRATKRGPAHLHRTLRRFDPIAARAIHPNDLPKIVRAIEVSVTAKRPITDQWQSGRDSLTGYSILHIGLEAPRPMLYARINDRAQAMFSEGLVTETQGLIARFGHDCRPFTSLGYFEASEVLRSSMSEAEAITHAQQGHRNYAKRQMTWFRRTSQSHSIHWLQGSGDSPDTLNRATRLVTEHLHAKLPT